MLEGEQLKRPRAIHGPALAAIASGNSFGRGFNMLTSTALRGVALMMALVCPTLSIAGPATGGATEWTQLANNAQLAKVVGLEGESLAKTSQILTAEVDQLRTQIETYQTILRNTEKLSDSFLRQAIEPIAKLQEVSQQVQGLARDGAALDTFLRSSLVSDPLYNKEELNEARLSERYDLWQEQWGGALETSLRASNLTLEDVASEGELIDTITKRFGGEEGHMQALQVANELSGSLARQMNQLRQLTATQSQQTSVAWGRVLADMDQEEAEARRFEQEINQSIDNIDGQAGQGRSIHEILGIGN